MGGNAKNYYKDVFFNLVYLFFCQEEQDLAYAIALSKAEAASLKQQ